MKPPMLFRILPAIFLLTACARPGQESAAPILESIEVDGVTRTYLLHVPAGYSPGEAWPLVFVFHGGFGNAEDTQAMTGFSNLADEAGFLVVYPNALHDHWNDGRSTDPLYTGTDDIGFVGALIDSLSTVYSIDPHRIFAAGISNGGIFSYRVACELSDEIAAIAPVAGSMAENLVGVCAPEQPISIIHIHGLADQLVRFEGGEVPGPYGGIVHPVLDTLALFVGWNGCTGLPETISLPDADPEDGMTVLVSTYNHCSNDTSIHLYAIQGGGHTWPGGSDFVSDNTTGYTNQDFSATQVIWAFFSQRPKP